jgi:hypothetical protein
MVFRLSNCCDIQVHSEVKFQKDMVRLLGGLDAVIAAGATNEAAGSIEAHQQQQQHLV